MISVWILWLIASAILVVLEMLSGTIGSLCFALGCLVTVIPALLDLSVVWQILVFVAVSAISFLYLRPVLRRLIKPRNTEEYRTNMDALIGRTGKVTHPITNNFDDKGRVQIDGDNWLAYTTSPDWPIPHGAQVVVESYDSLVLKVRPLKGQDKKA